MPSSFADAPSSFPATQQDPPTHAQPLEDVAASLHLLSEAPNPQGRTASVLDFDLNKGPNDPLPDESPKTSCTILLSPGSSHVQVNMDVEMETMGMTVMVGSSKITQPVDGRSLEEKSSRIVKAAKAKKKLIHASATKSGLGPSNTADAETSAIGGRKETAVPESRKPLVVIGATRSKEASRENATAASQAKEKGAPPVPTKGRLCSRNNGRANGWRCSAEAHPGYVVCLPHYINNRNSCEKWRARKLQARAESKKVVSKTADAGVSTSATGGRKETGPSSPEPLVGAKRRKAGARAVLFRPDEAGPAQVHTQMEVPCIVINIVVGSEQQQ